MKLKLTCLAQICYVKNILKYLRESHIFFFFVKISKTIKANGFHIFLRLGHHFVRALWCFLQ